MSSGGRTSKRLCAACTRPVPGGNGLSCLWDGKITGRGKGFTKEIPQNNVSLLKCGVIRRILEYRPFNRTKQEKFGVRWRYLKCDNGW